MPILGQGRSIPHMRSYRANLGSPNLILGFGRYHRPVTILPEPTTFIYETESCYNLLLQACKELNHGARLSVQFPEDADWLAAEELSFDCNLTLASKELAFKQRLTASYTPRRLIKKSRVRW